MAFREDGAGVSAVVASVLLVSIVMAMAVAAFVMVQKVSAQASIDDRSPRLALLLSPDEPTATVARTTDGLDWARDLRLGGTCSPLLNGVVFPTEPGTLVRPGDTLTCGKGETLTITSVLGKGDSLLFRHTF